MNPRHVPDIHPPLAPAPRMRPRLRDRAWWPWLTRGTLVLFGAFVLGLLLWQAMRVDWPAVFAAMFDAALNGFPTPPSGQRRIVLEIPR